jgi:hypothetical protein
MTYYTIKRVFPNIFTKQFEIINHCFLYELYLYRLVGASAVQAQIKFQIIEFEGES